MVPIIIRVSRIREGAGRNENDTVERFNVVISSRSSHTLLCAASNSRRPLFP